MSRPGSGQGRGGSPHTRNPSQQQRIASRNSSHSISSTSSHPTLVRDLKALVSQPVRLTLDDGRTSEIGFLWSYDVSMGIVALEIPRLPATIAYPATAASFPTAMLSTVKVAAQGGDSSGSRSNFKVVKLQRVQRVERLRSSPNNDSDVQSLLNAKVTPIHRDINVAAAEARERAATAEALKRAAKIGIGVSKMGQDVFDALNKTLPCRWADRHIIVMDEIVISPDNYDTAVIPNLSLSTLQTIAEGGTVPDAPEDAYAKATRWQRVSKVLAGERRKLVG